jgi:hypothetical protein
LEQTFEWGKIMKELDQLADAMDAVLEIITSELSDQEVTTNLRALTREANRVQGAIAAHATAMTVKKSYSATGHRSTAEFLPRTATTRAGTPHGWFAVPSAWRHHCRTPQRHCVQA